jgi:hypothetical protein
MPSRFDRWSSACMEGGKRPAAALHLHRTRSDAEPVAAPPASCWSSAASVLSVAAQTLGFTRGTSSALPGLRGSCWE